MLVKMDKKYLGLGLGIAGMFASISNVYAQNDSSWLNYPNFSKFESFVPLVREFKIVLPFLEEILNQQNLPFLEVEHKVKPGDNINKIASLRRVTPEHIAEKNDLESKTVKPGQKLTVVYENVWGLSDDTDKNFEVVRNMDYSNFKEFRKTIGTLSLESIIGAKLGDALYDNPATPLVNERVDEVNKYNDIFDKVSKKYNGVVSPEILKGIMFQESGGLIKAISRSGCLGPMGLSQDIWGEGNWPDNNFRLGINPFNVEDSIDRSANFLSYLMTFKYRSSNKNFNTEISLVAYNQGETQLDKRIIIYASKIKGEKFSSFRKAFNYLDSYAKNTNSYGKILKGILETKDIKSKKILPAEGRLYPGNIKSNKKLISLYNGNDVIIGQNKEKKYLM